MAKTIKTVKSNSKDTEDLDQYLKKQEQRIEILKKVLSKLKTNINK